MQHEWNHLGEGAQLALSSAALSHAAGVLAAQAETLADEMAAGMLVDRGGPEALRLFAAVVRALYAEEMQPLGRA